LCVGHSTDAPNPYQPFISVNLLPCDSQKWQKKGRDEGAKAVLLGRWAVGGSWWAGIRVRGRAGKTIARRKCQCLKLFAT